jgi:hypothetical protein
MIRMILALGATATLCACAPQGDTQTAQSIAQLSERFGRVEARMSKLETAPAAGVDEVWVLWHAETNLKTALNGLWPTAESAYPTKEGCLAAGALWSLPDGKQLSTDPVVVENKEWRMTVRCLPKGVDPIQRH